MEQGKKTVFTLEEIYDEVWEYNCRNDEKFTKRGDNSSSYRRNLNKMFEAIFGQGYGDILINDGKDGAIYANEKVFIEFLLVTFPSVDGKKLRANEELDRNYENDLLYYASLFLEVRKEKEKRIEVDIKTDDLAIRLMERFGLNNGQMRLIKTLQDFNRHINELIYEPEMQDDPRSTNLYAEFAERIDRLYESILFKY